MAAEARRQLLRTVLGSPKRPWVVRATSKLRSNQSSSAAASASSHVTTYPAPSASAR